MFELVKGYSDAPDVDIRISVENLLPQRLAPAVKRAIALPETEIWGVRFGESRAVRPATRVDAAGGDVSPRDIRGIAGLSDDPRQNSIAGKAVRLVNFACVHIRLSGVSCCINEELGFLRSQLFGQLGDICVVDLGATQASESDPLACEVSFVCIAYIAGTTQQVDHDTKLFRELDIEGARDCSFTASDKQFSIAKHVDPFLVVRRKPLARSNSDRDRTSSVIQAWIFSPEKVRLGSS